MDIPATLNPPFSAKMMRKNIINIMVNPMWFKPVYARLFEVKISNSKVPLA